MYYFEEQRKILKMMRIRNFRRRIRELKRQLQKVDTNQRSPSESRPPKKTSQGSGNMVMMSKILDKLLSCRFVFRMMTVKCEMKPVRESGYTEFTRQHHQTPPEFTRQHHQTAPRFSPMDWFFTIPITSLCIVSQGGKKSCFPEAAGLVVKYGFT